MYRTGTFFVLALLLAACGGRTAPGAWWVDNGNGNNANANANVNANTNTNSNTNASYCGDGVCDFDEYPTTCPEDCAYCGDNMCLAGETPVSCPEDCPGSRSCQGVLLCAFCCNEGDDECEQACRNRGTPEARVEWQDFRACSSMSCFPLCYGTNSISPQCIMCAMQECNDRCGYGEVGTANCSTTLNCLAGCSSIETGGTAEVCNDDPGVQCHDNCFAAADAQAIALYDAWVLCLVDACGDRCDPVADARGCIDCALQHCAPEMNACYNESGGP